MCLKFFVRALMANFVFINVQPPIRFCVANVNEKIEREHLVLHYNYYLYTVKCLRVELAAGSLTSIRPSF